ncbi:hypothetical protein QYM41_11100 [Kocuria sp. CPCC 205268]|uniref:hypothetical protein n=1 Tax=Kocuria oxytropis TaxID=3058913 RepID=UPI0034D60D4B
MDAWKTALAGAVAAAALWSGAAPAAAAGDRLDLLLGTRLVLDEATVGQATEGAARLCGGPPKKYVQQARKAARTGSIVVLCTGPRDQQVYFR